MPGKWFARTFEFTTPADAFPGLVERLRGTPARVEDRVSDLSRDTLIARDGERWSIQENVGHLYDLEPLWLERVHQLAAGAEVMAAADLTNRRTHEARHNERPITDVLRDFRAARGELVAAMSSADEAAVVRSALHPRLNKPMRLVDLAFFVAEHDDHHLATITELVRPRGGA